MNIDGKTQIYGIIGHPISHTMSPALHNTAFDLLGINARYIPFHVLPDNLPAALHGLRALGIMGLNVTVPHKTAVIPLLDEIRGDASVLKAVNTIVNENGRLIGHNTDAAGLRLSLSHSGLQITGKNATVLGAGGAARAAVLALHHSGAAHITIVNRTHDKAISIAHELSETGANISTLSLSSTDTLHEQIKNSMIIVNTTSLGLHPGDPLPLEPDLITSQHTVVDLIYNPAETPLLTAAKSCGATTVNGYGMLVFQAIEAFSLWTGTRPPADNVWHAGATQIGHTDSR